MTVLTVTKMIMTMTTEPLRRRRRLRRRLLLLVLLLLLLILLLLLLLLLLLYLLHHLRLRRLAHKAIATVSFRTLFGGTRGFGVPYFNTL